MSLALSSRSSDGDISSPPRTPDENMPPLTEIVPETIPESNTQESETLQSLRDTIRRLENRLQSEGSSRNRRRSSSASSMDGCTAKLFKNIPEFTLDFRLQQRQEWILDLEYSFKGAKRRLRRDDQKIIAALPHMSPICRQRWYRHLAEKERDQRRNAEESWQYFTEWTLSLIRNSATLQPDTMSQLQRARQRKDQDPREFHAYLDSLEQHFPRQSERERALTFFAKLLPELSKYIQEHHIKLPDQRDEMVTLATHHWNLLYRGQKRKRDASSKESKNKDDKSNKDKEPQNTKENSKENSKKPNKNPTDDKGNPLRCYTCNSDSHLANHCPKKKKATVQSAEAEEVDSESENNSESE